MGCTFQNPRGWVTCARCGQLLGPRTVGTSVTALSALTRRISGAASDSSPFNVANASEADALPFIGQNRSVTAIQKGMAASFGDRAPSVTALSGPAGAGRTRLLIRASELAAKSFSTVRILYAQCRTRDDGPYAPFSRLLRERFGILPASSPSVVRGQMATTVADALESTDAVLISETTHLLGHVAGVPFPDSPFLQPLASNPEELHRRACQAVRRFVEGDARRKSLMLLFDDMGEAEPEAWSLLTTLLTVRAPLAVVIAGSEPMLARVTEAAGKTPLFTAEIRPLTNDEIIQLTKSFIPDLVATPEPFVAALTHRTRGNPGTLRELLHSLLEGGLFTPGPKGGLQVDLKKIEASTGPLTMEDAIRARLQGLDERERAVVDRAAVVGESFREGAVLAIQRAEVVIDGRLDPLEAWSDDSDEVALTHALSRLEEKGFVVRIEDSEIPGFSEYTFQHTGTRSIIYGALDPDVRRVRHAAAARWLSMLATQRTDVTAAIIAPHLEHGGLADRAGLAYLQAASEERARMRTTMALRYIEKALSLIDQNDLAVFDAFHEHGSLLAVLGRFDEANVAFNHMLHIAWVLGARGKAGAALNRIARVYRQRGQHKEALDHLERALTLFRTADDHRGVASTLDDLAQVQRLRGDIDPALRSAREALELRRREKDTRGEGVSLNTIGAIEIDRGDFEGAENHLARALDLRLSSGDHEGAAQTRISQGRLLYFTGKLPESLTVLQLALDGAREMANQQLQAHALNQMGETLLMLGKADEANACLEQAKDLAARIRDQRVLAEVERNLGLVGLRRGDTSAQVTLEGALTLAVDYGTREVIALAHRAMARLQARTLFGAEVGTTSRAEKSFRQCIEIFEECGNRHERARTLAELGFHLVERGERDAARTTLSEALAVMETLRLPELSMIRETLAQL